MSFLEIHFQTQMFSPPFLFYIYNISFLIEDRSISSDPSEGMLFFSYIDEIRYKKLCEAQFFFRTFPGEATELLAAGGRKCGGLGKVVLIFRSKQMVHVCLSGLSLLSLCPSTRDGAGIFGSHCPILVLEGMGPWI